jgi:hypothetical protein
MQILLECQNKTKKENAFSSGLDINWTGSELDEMPNFCERNSSNKSLAPKSRELLGPVNEHRL